MRVPDRALLNVPVPVPLQRRRSGYDKRGRSHEAPVRFDVAMALESFEKYLGRYEIEEKRLKLGEVLGRGWFLVSVCPCVCLSSLWLSLGLRL